MTTIDYSINDFAEEVAGKRPTDGIAFDQPMELGYHCPICDYPMYYGDIPDERLHWSEYNGFVWCSVCNVDYPSCFCYNEKSEIPLFMKKQFSECKSNYDFATAVYLKMMKSMKKNEMKLNLEQLKIIKNLLTFKIADYDDFVEYEGGDYPPDLMTTFHIITNEISNI